MYLFRVLRAGPEATVCVDVDSAKVKTVSELVAALRPHLKISSRQTAVLRAFSTKWEKAPVLTTQALLQLYQDMRAIRLLAVLADAR